VWKKFLDLQLWLFVWGVLFYGETANIDILAWRWKEFYERYWGFMISTGPGTLFFANGKSGFLLSFSSCVVCVCGPVSTLS
jgi:hypothetical protein